MQRRQEELALLGSEERRRRTAGERKTEKEKRKERKREGTDRGKIEKGKERKGEREKEREDKLVRILRIQQRAPLVAASARGSRYRFRLSEVRRRRSAHSHRGPLDEGVIPRGWVRSVR